MADYTIPRQTDYEITFNYLNNDDSARALNGATVYFTIKDTDYDGASDDTGALLTKDITLHSDPGGGETLIELDDTDTDQEPGVYFYDIVVVESDTKRYRAKKGTVEITSGSTNR